LEAPSDNLAFSCKRGSIIAIFAKEKYHFWLAEAATPINKGPPEQNVSIFFYTAVDNPDTKKEEYTYFEVEGGRRKRMQLDYRHCLSVVSYSRKRRILFLSLRMRETGFAL
tara:strand:- start:983 stop:1315 length:333 start_codon:yes stop_codon:yes gene_type:complete